MVARSALHTTALSSVFALLAIGASGAGLTQNATCYFPNRKEAPGNFPCFLGQEVSACCGGGSVCEASGLCRPGNSKSGDFNLIRGACTDREWKSPACPQFCPVQDTGGNNVISCMNVTKSSIDFCCDHTNGCCDSGIERFQVLGNVDIVTLATTGATITTSVPGSASTAITTVLSFSSLVTTGTSSSSSAESRIISPTGSPLPTPVSTPIANAQQESSGASSGLSTGTKAGIGIGCALFVLAFIGVNFWVWRRVMRKRSEHKPLEHSTETAPWLAKGEISGVSRPSELSSTSLYDTPRELPAKDRYHPGPPGELAA